MNIIEKSFDGIYVKLDGEDAIFGYSSKPQRARCTYLLEKEIKKGNKSFEIKEKPCFDLCGAMVDVSRGGVLTVNAVKKFIDASAALGLNMLMLYTEDMFEMKKYPMFGYMRGRYSLSEFQSMDDYAAECGVELIPCIQTLGHLNNYIMWGEVPSENASVLLVGEEKTYEFIEEEIKFMSSALRSKKIHLGMDEASGLGLGKYLKLHGYRDKMEIFNEHLRRVIGIAKKYGYEPMIWSDMYYSSKDGQDYYEPDYVIPQKAIDDAPLEAAHVFWDYYHKDYDYYNKKLAQEKRFNNEVIFAGGIWTWDGFLPNFRYTYESMAPALTCAIDNGVKKIIATMWGNDGCETDSNLAMSSLAIFSEYCYKGKECTLQDIYDAAEYVSGENSELTQAISDFGLSLDGAQRIGKGILYSDLLIDTFCYDIDLNSVATTYKKSLDILEKYSDNKNAPYYKAVFEAAFEKCCLLRDLRREYLTGNKEYILNAADNLIPSLREKYKKLYKEFEKLWKASYKPFGFEKFPVRFGGIDKRLENVADTLRDYAEGKTKKVDELAEKLCVSWKEFSFYSRV